MSASGALGSQTSHRAAGDARSLAERSAEQRTLSVVPLDAEIAIEADGLQMHEDPADRFIVATALRCKALLVTKDRAMRSAKLVPVVW